MVLRSNSDFAEVALLTGGADQPYAFGLAQSLTAQGVSLDLIGNDHLDSPQWQATPNLRFFNLRGDQTPDVGRSAKALRVLKYYVRLIGYSVTAKPKIFHILWNNKFEYFDRTLLMLWYRLLGRRIVLTLHNINARRRDGKDSFLNRLTLRIQYRLSEQKFVHTERMKAELMEEFGEKEEQIVVIPFGINNAVPNTSLTCAGARARLGIQPSEKVLLFFGHIAPYKGLEYLVSAFRSASSQLPRYRLIVAGRPKNCEQYWKAVRNEIDPYVKDGRVILRDHFIPDEDTEIYFKAADVLVLPYRNVYQSGVLFLGYSFGLPVLAADVGSLKEEIVEGRTGFAFQPESPDDLQKAVERYFESELYRDLNHRRAEIRDYATERHSWDIVAQITRKVYLGRTNDRSGTKVLSPDTHNT